MKVYLAVVNTLADWEIGYLTAELYSKRFFRSPDIHCELVKVGIDLAPVTSMGGMQIAPDVALADVRLAADDLYIMPGSEQWEQEKYGPLVQFAADALEQGHHVAAICGATMGLAAAGVLNTRRHTSNDISVIKQSGAAYQGEKLYEKKPAVRDGNLITASGLAPLEFTYEVMGLLEVWSGATAAAWLKLFQTREKGCYYALVDSMSILPSAP